MHIVSSTIKYNDSNFSYIKISNVDLQAIKSLPLYANLDVNEVVGQEVLLYSFAKEETNNCAKIGTVERIVTMNDCIKFILKNIENAEVTCGQVNVAIYRFKLKNGASDIKYNYFLDDEQFNNIMFPEARNDKKYQNLESELRDLKAQKKWLDMIRRFGDLDKFETNYPDLYNDDKFLDKFIVYPLSHLVTPGDKYKVRTKFEKYFIKFSDRTLKLFPCNVAYLSVRAYFHYLRYMSQNLSLEKEYNEAAIYLQRILSINARHSTSIYRLARLQQEYLDNKKFDSSVNKQELRKISEDYYQEFLNIYLNESDEFKKDNKKNYNKSMYNLAKLKLESQLDCEFIFFDRFIIGENVDLFLTKQKEELIINTLQQMINLMNTNNFSINSSFEELSNLKNIDPINLMYRISQCYQYLGLFKIMQEGDNAQNDNFSESNKYIKRCFKHAFDLESKGKHINKPNYLHIDQSVNYYFIGEKEKCYEKLEKGQSDAWYRGAQLAYYENNITKARFFIDKIKQKDVKKMINKTLELEKRLND